MSVLIKGMEMPTLYKTYKVRFAETNDGKVVVGIADENSTAYRPLGEVVRCKDCRHRDPEDHKCDSGEMERQGCPFKVADDYFCAYGER